MRTAATVVASLSLLFTACPPAVDPCVEDPSQCDAGGLPPDFCNSQEEAEADSTNCHVTATTNGAAAMPKTGVYLSRLSDGGVDTDWYFVQLGELNARSLLHVTGGYQVPQTAVNFSLNVLTENGSGLKSIVSGVDNHGAAAPKPVDLIVPFSTSNAKLWIVAADQGTGSQIRVDNRNPYSLAVEVRDNPDTNEPNDTTPTPLTFMPAGALPTASASGYLATTNDLDVFSFEVPTGARKILYFHLGEMGEHPTNPPPPYRLSYRLVNPDGTALSEGSMDNNTLPIDLSTARQVTAGRYTLEVKGYSDPSDPNPKVGGDLRVQYTVTLQLLDDVDTNEPNDTVAAARVVSIAPNGRTTLTGRLSYVADEEWFTLNLGSRGTPSTLRYKLTVDEAAGRFPALSATPARELRLTREVTTGATTEDRRQACKTDRAVCPHAEDDTGVVNELCAITDPPLCLQSQRVEDLRMAKLHNFVGALSIKANQASQLHISFRDQGFGLSKYADDRVWTLELEWVDDGDEAGRSGAQVVTLGAGPSSATGALTFGYGRELDPDWDQTDDGIRGIEDYDIEPTDKDLFQFDVSGVTGAQSWSLSWDLQKPDGGANPPGSLAFEFTFCSAPGSQADGGLCVGEQRRIFAYNDQSLTPWYLPQSAPNGRMLFTRSDTMTSTTFTVAPVTCACLNAGRVAAGVVFANVGAVHRLSNDPIQYRITQSLAPYPPGSFTVDGGAFTCPVSATDGGCGFIP